MKSFSLRTIAILLVILSQLYSARAQRIVNYVPDVINNGINYNSIFFSGEGRKGWITGDQGKILYTENGGKNWKEADLMAEKEGRTVGRLNNVFFANDSLGWVVGENGNILLSRDGGIHWRAATQVPGHQNVNSIFFTANLRFGVAACDNAQIWISQDTGRTWIVNNNIGGQQDHRMLDARISSDGKHLVVCGKYGSLVHSDNGGTHFSDAYIDDPAIRREGTREHIYRMHFSADCARGVASCESGHILATTDSGRTWKTTTLHPNHHKNITGTQR